MKLKTTWLDLTNREFESLEDISKVYGKSLPVPKVSSSTATASYPLNQNECQDYFNLVSKSQQYHTIHTIQATGQNSSYCLLRTCYILYKLKIAIALKVL